MSTPVPANGIFFTEKELEKQYNERLKGPGGGGQNWYTDRVRGGISRDIEGNIQRDGLSWLLQGLEKEGFAETAADRREDIDDARTVQTAVKESKVDLDKLQESAKGRTLTADNVGNLIRTTNKKIADEPTAMEKAQMVESKARTTLAESELAEVRAQAANTLELARLTRADNMDARAADLEFRRDQMMLEDQRYNERLDREFQQRRKESLMAMMQGLASLGAAFAA